MALIFTGTFRGSVGLLISTHWQKFNWRDVKHCHILYVRNDIMHDFQDFSSFFGVRLSGFFTTTYNLEVDSNL